MKCETKSVVVRPKDGPDDTRICRCFNSSVRSESTDSGSRLAGALELASSFEFRYVCKKRMYPYSSLHKWRLVPAKRGPFVLIIVEFIAGECISEVEFSDHFVADDFGW